MRLIVNATSYGEPAGGAAVRARELYGGLRGYELCFLLAKDSPDWVVPPGAERQRLPVRAGRPLRRWRRLRIPAGGDLFLTDHYPAHARLPTIVTLHDCGKSWLRRRMIRRHLRRAAAVVAVSETVRAAWGIDAAVILNGTHPIAERVPGEHLLLCDPGLAHKGAGLARATARALGRPLREIGRGVRWLDRDEMASELAQAAVVLCPSQEEGFGLVPLEAMAAGRPVVVSDLPAHREVCGDAVFYAAPGDERAWQAATALALEFAHQPMPDARRRAEQFSWEAAVRHLDALIRGLRSWDYPTTRV